MFLLLSVCLCLFVCPLNNSNVMNGFLEKVLSPILRLVRGMTKSPFTDAEMEMGQWVMGHSQ